MADNTEKVDGNVEGPFFVDSNCIDCDLCHSSAPDNFDRNEDEGLAFVCKQPENDDEEKLCRDAIDECPVEAIGDDG